MGRCLRLKAVLLVQGIEACQSGLAVLAESTTYALQRLALPQLGLGVELIRVADQLLLGALRRVDAWGEGDSACGDLLGSEAATRVALSDPSVTRQTQRAQELGTEVAVQDVGCLARAEDFGRTGLIDPDVVEHRRLCDELAVESHLGVCIDELEGQPRDVLGVLAQYALDVATLGVVAMDDGEGVYHLLAGAASAGVSVSVVLLSPPPKRSALAWRISSTDCMRRG